VLTATALLFVTFTIMVFGWTWPQSVFVEVLAVLASPVVAVAVYVILALKARQGRPN